MAILFDTSYNHYGGSYDRYNVKDAKGRNWKIVYDSSIHKVNHDRCPTTSQKYAVEVISPILEYEDIPKLQEVVRVLRKVGGVTGAEYGCGIHLYIDGEPYNAKTLRNLVKIFLPARRICCMRLCRLRKAVKIAIVKKSILIF